MARYLPTCELTAYISGYIALVAYGTWQLYLLGPTVYSEADASIFRAGWLLNRPQELDQEWTVWTEYFHANWFAFVSHAIISELTARYLRFNVGRYVRAGVGIAATAYSYGPLYVVGILLSIGAFLGLAQLRRKTYVWLLAAAYLAGLNTAKWMPLEDYLSAEDRWAVLVILTWNCLRLLSATLDVVDELQTDVAAVDKTTACDVIGYVLYVPTLFYGPIVLFGRYKRMLVAVRSDRAPLAARLWRLGFQCARIAGQCAAIELLAHLFYLNGLMNVELCERMPLTSLYAFGFIMGTVFYLKYRVCYGWSLALAQFDGMPTPNLPKFIGRVHLYSDMWKWFDHGLYEFLHTYIYAALCSPRHSPLGQRLLSSAVTFAFIYGFHGFYDYVLMWSIANYACIVLETIGRRMCRSVGRSSAGRWMGADNQWRLLAVVGSQLFIPAVLSNFYFFAGVDVGWVFVRRTYLESGWPQYAALTGCAVCIFHASEWLKRAEQSAQR